MKRDLALPLALIALIGSALACASSTQMPVPKIDYTGPESETAVPTQPETTPTASVSSLPTSVVCREKPGNALPFRTWRNADTPRGSFSVHIYDVGPAADSESVWLSTSRGLARLNLRTWQCDLLTQAADVPLASTFQVVLPDGEGGYWVGAGRHLLHLSNEGWQMAYQDRSNVTSIGLSQAGDLCMDMFKQYHRGFDEYKVCFKSSELPLPAPEKIEDCYGEACPLRPSNCDIWQSLSGEEYTSSGGLRRYRYATPGECEQTQQIEASFADDDTDLLVAFSEDGGEVWSVKRKYSENTTLLYQTDGISHQEEIPYYVRGLASDHAHGGVWLAVEDGLVHVKVGDGSVPRFTFHPLSVDFEIPSLDTGPFPGEVRGLVGDEAGRVWAVNGTSVLLYDDADATRPVEGWQEVASPTGGTDAIVADPRYGVWPSGVWVAGRGELVHLDGTHRQAWPMPDMLTSAPTALLIDRSGRVWMGTTENGIWTTMPSTPAGDPLPWRAFTPEDGLESASITALTQGPRGCIYAAHLAGIGILCPSGEIESGHWTTLHGSNLSEYGWVNALAFVAPTGELWAGTHPEGTLQRYNGSWTDLSPAWYASVGALMVDDAGTLWAGASREWTCGGLRYRLATAEGERDWQTFDPEGLAVCNVLALAQDSRGRLWIGGPEGVVMWKGGQ